MLLDKFGRKINYLRLAVTDRCNLRCTYCMPEEGILYEKREDILSYEEMFLLVQTLVKLGVTKVRLTGGEPFVRKDFVLFLAQLDTIKELEEINITTNGTLISKYLNDLKGIKKLHSINLSIDSLDASKFKKITRRDNFDEVQKAFERLIQSHWKIKLNVVMIPNINTTEISQFIALTKYNNISVRFIEEMPFNGTGKRKESTVWDRDQIFNFIDDNFNDILKIKHKKNSSSENFRIKNYKGSFGIIPAYTRTICGECNRIRITAKGLLKLCLFDEGIFDLRQFLRRNNGEEELKRLFYKVIDKKPKNGFVAEKNRKNTKLVSESMSTIGG